METEKNHSIKHAPNDIVKWGDSINMSCEAQETGHKEWVKKQGAKTNQGPAIAFSMAQHTVRKEASVLLCEAVQGAFVKYYAYFTYNYAYSTYLQNIAYIAYYAYLSYCNTFWLPARMDDKDPDFSDDDWFVIDRRVGK